MIFRDILDRKAAILRPAFDRLFEAMLQNQTHPSDALLIRVNGFFNPEVLTWTLPKRMSPYVIGPSDEGHSEQLHYKFIHSYRRNGIVALTHEEYLEQLVYSPERSREIDEYTELEGTSIQLEMLVYLKIWEADAFIKKFYQTVRLVSGEAYDWHFKIAGSNRDKDATGTRESIIRLKIRDRLQSQFPEIYSAFKNAYLTQLRNSIAHSKYAFLGRNIHPNNYISSDLAAQIQNVPFDQWIDMFHDTLIIYNEYLRLSTRINEYYAAIAQANHNLVEVRISREVPEVSVVYKDLKYRVEYQDWNWEQNER